MKTAYYEPRIISPFQVRKAPDTESKNHPSVSEEVKKSVGTYDLTIEFEEDRETLETFKNLSNLIAFTCRIKKGGEIIGFGHGASVISRMNKFVDRTVRSALNASLVDAIVRSKMLDVLHFGSKPQEASTSLSEIYKDNEITESITDKQKSYLLELIQSNITNKEERNKWESQVSGLSKYDASEMISSFVMAK